MEPMNFPSLVFYVLAALTVFSGVLVISARNPVHSVLSLIFAFFNAAGLFVLLGAEYVAMTLVIVYVGAVAVLFLFVVMMLNINFAEMRQGFLKYLPIGVGLAAVLFAELFMVMQASALTQPLVAEVANPTPAVAEMTNTRALGGLLYTHYFPIFQLAGIILLVAMIGAIVLTLRHRPDVRRQQISKQLARDPKDSVTLVKVKSGEGIG